jgi:hypothetical protein
MPCAFGKQPQKSKNPGQPHKSRVTKLFRHHIHKMKKHRYTIIYNKTFFPSPVFTFSTEEFYQQIFVNGSSIVFLQQKEGLTFFLRQEGLSDYK